MSRRLILGAALAIALPGLGLPPRATAQEASAKEADLIRRIDSLLAARPNTEEDDRRRAAARNALRANWDRRSGGFDVAFDTATVGPLTVVAPVDQLDEAKTLYATAWSAYAASVSGAEAVLSDVRFGFKSSRRNGETREHTAIVRPWASKAEREYRTNAVIATALGSLMPRDLAGWAGTMPLLGESETKYRAALWQEVFAESYRRLAITPARAASGCFDGDIASCVTVLGLDRRVGWSDLYAPEELRALAREYQTRTQDLRDLQFSCVREQDDDACAALLSVGWSEPYLTMPGQWRYSLLLHALEWGGKGSFSRLIAEGDLSIAERLEAASGMALDDLVRSWRERVIEARVPVTAGLPLSILFSLLWIALFSFLGFRSTRWRIG